MLRTLYIRDYALIEELEVEFGPGLNVITGETGAGKSILVGAMKMILGERASTEVVRSGARKAVIEGVFDGTDVPALPGVLLRNEIEPGAHVIMRREISASQSRAFINDTPATAQLMREVASLLIDLHGQHEHQSLLHPETHLGLLDNFGALGALPEAYRAAYAETEALVVERRRLMARERELRQQKELYGFQIEEIDKVGPVEGEEEDLEAEQRVLENAEHLFSTTARLYQALYEAEDALQDGLARAHADLADLARIDEAFAEPAGEMQSAHIVVSETAKFLQDYNARIEFNPERLERIRERLGALEMLKRKYGGSVAAVVAYRREIGATYDLAADFEGAIARLSEQIAASQERLRGQAEALSAARKAAAARLEKAIVEELKQLGMAHSRFEVRFETQPDRDGWIPPGPGRPERCAAFASGMDAAEFYISANPGEAVKPLARVASGGEVSRIMLSLKSVLARGERMPILVFDEIDTGISGVIARKVGQAMHALASSHQIIAITHLPQIAALGDRHFVVAKSVEDGRTRTELRRVAEAERAAQVAALISGDHVSAAALESARQLMRERGADAA